MLIFGVNNGGREQFGEQTHLSVQAVVRPVERRAKSISVPPKLKAGSTQASSPCSAREDDFGQDSSGMLRTILCTEQLRTL